MDKQLTFKECHEYWKNPGDKNSPEKYVAPLERSKLIYEYIKKYSTKESSLLEPGCNVGRNLNYLFEKGYTNLTGIEINNNALELLKTTYPKLSDKVHLLNSSFEEILPKIKSQFDLVYTMAVLEHIHTESEWIFKELARMTKKFLIIMEAETVNHPRFFPRNYQEIFENFGFKQVDEQDCSEVIEHYTLRVLKKI